MTRFVGLLLTSTLGCGLGPLPPDLGGDVFWIEVDLDDAEDLGGDASEIPPAERAPPGPITLVDVSDAAGLADVRAGGNTHGVGIGFVDLDGDDWADIFVVNGRSNVTSELIGARLLRNRRDGTFEDVTAASGVGPILEGRDGYSIAAGDVDADGDIDVYVGAQPTDVLLRNRGDGTFEDATAQAGAGGPTSDPGAVGDGKSKIVAMGDFDGDGRLDLVSASSTLPDPGAYLLRNIGDGTFEDITAASNVRVHPTGNPCAVMWSDYDTDGDPDLWIWNDRGGHLLLRNGGGQSFEDVTGPSRLDDVTITHPMGIDSADIDHDGDLDTYVSNIGDNPLLRNNGDGTFVDITGHAGTQGEYGWGLGFEDFDGDGWADIFVAQEDDRPNLVFHNLGQVPSRFERIEVPHPAVISSGAAHNVAVAFADYDHDGRTDVVTARTDGSRITLYRNETDRGTHGWLDVVVMPQAAATESSDGIGARVAVGTGELIQFRDVTGGSSRASQTELSVRFGLGSYRGADWVAVLWPTGRQHVVRNAGGAQRLQLP